MDTSRSGRRQGIPVLVLGIALLVGDTGSNRLAR